jgi:hypothetical protein
MDTAVLKVAVQTMATGMRSTQSSSPRAEQGADASACRLWPLAYWHRSTHGIGRQQPQFPPRLLPRRVSWAPPARPLGALLPVPEQNVSSRVSSQQMPSTTSIRQNKMCNRRRGTPCRLSSTRATSAVPARRAATEQCTQTLPATHGRTFPPGSIT